MASEETSSLALLPGELVSLVCLRLDTRSVARLEQCSLSLRRVIQVRSPARAPAPPRPPPSSSSLLLLQECGVWKRRADRCNRADPFPFISGMLQYLAQRQLTDTRAHKIVLGSR